MPNRPSDPAHDPISIQHYHWCKNPEVIGVEYAYDTPEYYDGVSEWLCAVCGIRVGRWTRRTLKENEVEPVFGSGRITIF